MEVRVPSFIKSVNVVLVGLKREWFARELRIAVPSSPAPRTRMEDGIAIALVLPRYLGQ